MQPSTKQFKVSIVSKTLWTVIAMLCVSELLLRIPIIEKRAPLPALYYDTGVVEKIRQIEARNDIKIWLLGSSVVRTNVNAGRLSSELKAGVANLGLSALSPDAVLFYTKNLYSPYFKTDDLVIQFVRVKDITTSDSFIKNPDYNSRLERFWKQPSWVGRCENFASQYSALYRQYGSLSRAHSEVRIPSNKSHFPTDAFGFGPGVDGLEKPVKQLEKYPPGPLKADPEVISSLKKTQREVEQRGARYVLCAMPDPKEKYASESGLAQLQQKLGLIGTQLGVQVINIGSVAPESDDFSDENHMNKKGAERFTTQLQNAIQSYLQQ
jgi:hypothetical protein